MCGVSILGGGIASLALVFLNCWTSVGLVSAGCWAVGSVPISVVFCWIFAVPRMVSPLKSLHRPSNDL